MKIKPGLFLNNVSIKLEGKELILIDDQVLPGEVLTIMGPSGCGKSSLLAYIGGFLDSAFVACGSVFVDDVNLIKLPANQRRTGILFQDAMLFGHMSVVSNLMFAIPAAVKSRAKRREIASLALDEIGLSGLEERDPETLSGGQKARVALQRVLLSEPRLLLLDEPFSKLDTQLREQVRRIVFDKAIAANLPILLVTHDEADAASAGGKVFHVGRQAS